MAENNHGLSRNPNVCASCSSMADGMAGTATLSDPCDTAAQVSSLGEPSLLTPEAPPQQVVIEWASGRALKRE
jgi:hypothetical protein